MMNTTRKRWFIFIFILIAIILLYSPLKTVYISIISQCHTLEETKERASIFFNEIEDLVNENGYSMNKVESSWNSSMGIESYEFTSNSFDFKIDIVSEKGIENIYLNYNMDKYPMSNADVSMIYKVFNKISACNISKRAITRALKNIEISSAQSESTLVYEKNLLFMSDLCRISCYVDNENNKIFQLLGVPEL